MKNKVLAVTESATSYTVPGVAIDREKLELCDILTLRENDMSQLRADVMGVLSTGITSTLLSIDSELDYLFGVLYAGSSHNTGYARSLRDMERITRASVLAYNIPGLLEERAELVSDLHSISNRIAGIINRAAEQQDDAFVQALREMYIRGFVKAKLDAFTRKSNQVLQELVADITRRIKQNDAARQILSKRASEVQAGLNTRVLNHLDLIWKIEHTPSCYLLDPKSRVVIGILKLLMQVYPDTFGHIDNASYRKAFISLRDNPKMDRLTDLVRRRSIYLSGQEVITLPGDRKEVFLAVAQQLNREFLQFFEKSRIILDGIMGSAQPVNTPSPSSSRIRHITVLGDSIAAGPPGKGSDIIEGGILLHIDGIVPVNEREQYGFIDILGRVCTAQLHNVSFPGITIDSYLHEEMFDGPLRNFDFSQSLVIIELGINDYGSCPIADIQDNLHRMIAFLKEKQAQKIVLLGFSQKPEFDSSDIEEAFRQVAEQEGIVLVPNMFEGILWQKEFYELEVTHKDDSSRLIIPEINDRFIGKLGFQVKNPRKSQRGTRIISDFLHPNELGHIVMAAHLFVQLKPVLDEFGLYQPA